MSAAKSTRRVNSMAIVGLVVISLLLIYALYSLSFVNPIIPLSSVPPNAPPPPPLVNGTLVVDLSSNQNESDRLSNPTNQSLPIEEWPVNVTQAASSSIPLIQQYLKASNTTISSTLEYLLTTDSGGVASQQLPAGSYLVHVQVETLNLTIPVQVYAGNVSSLEVKVFGTAYPLLYSLESGFLLAPSSVQSGMYVEFRSSTPANVSAPVLLKVFEGTSGAGYLVNATVVSQQPPTQGTQWLEVGTTSAVDLSNATSIVLTTWTYSSLITVTPVEPSAGVHP